jgi:hypothetical protein
MPGPLPKPAAARRRRNIAPGSRTLRTVEQLSTPTLPFPVSGMTQALWTDIWSSPMAPEYDPSDLHGLYRLARLVDDFWAGSDPVARAKTLVEITHVNRRARLFTLSERLHCHSVTG